MTFAKDGSRVNKRVGAGMSSMVEMSGKAELQSGIRNPGIAGWIVFHTMSSKFHKTGM